MSGLDGLGWPAPEGDAENIENAFTYPSEMTNDIAFELGKGDCLSFYDQATWIPNVEKFNYIHFFSWGNPVKSSKDADFKDFFWLFYGSLRDGAFKTVEHKRFYIKGVCSSYAAKVNLTSIEFNFANSLPTKERLVKWINEVLKEKFGGSKLWSMNSFDRRMSYPMICNLTLEADEEIIKFLTE